MEISRARGLGSGQGETRIGDIIERIFPKDPPGEGDAWSRHPGLKMRLQFGDCLFDSETREVFRKQKPAHLSPKAFRLLELLLEDRPRALPKDELHEKVWPGTFISEATLASAIAEIRAALGDSGRKEQFVRTVHGYGYAFCGETLEAPRASAGPAAEDTCYRLVWNGREISLVPGENVLGRDRQAVAWIDDTSVSRRHARILIRKGSARLEDLQSKNGTYLSGARIDEPVELHDGDVIRLGSASLTFRVFSAAGSTATQIAP
jgi:DNA-binding winged helix-turn-helix (wHTH) protein